MEEQEILNQYIKGIKHGEDNKLRATIGSLNAKRTNELNGSIHNLIISILSSADKASNGFDQLNSGIASQVHNLMESNKRLSVSNERYAEWNRKLTVALFLSRCWSASCKFM